MKMMQATTTHRFPKAGALTRMRSEPVRPISELIVAWIDPSQFPHIKQTIEKHGGTVTIQKPNYYLSFPAGTVQKDLPDTGGVPRQNILFPDGWALRYEHARGSRLPKIIVDAAQGGEPDA